MKKVIFSFILGGLIFGSIGICATNIYQAETIQYKDGNVSDALNNLYQTNNEIFDTKITEIESNINKLNNDLILKRINVEKTVSLKADSAVNVDFSSYIPEGYRYLSGTFSWGGANYGHITMWSWASTTIPMLRIKSDADVTYTVPVSLTFIKSEYLTLN